MSNNEIQKSIPKVSVITITKDLLKDKREHLFKNCLKSVHNQTYKNIEHVIIDGASTDGTLNLIKSYEEQNWVKCYSQPDQGIDDAYNKGLQKISGDYVVFMNSDDCFYSKDTIELCINKMEEAKADYCYGSIQERYRDGKLGPVCHPKVENFWKNMPFSHQSLFVKKSVMDELGGYNTDCGFGGDVFLVFELILKDYKGIEIPAIIANYYLGGLSSQNEDLKKLYQVYGVLAKRYQYLYSLFYENISIEESAHIFHNGDKKDAYPPFFLPKLISFMVKKNLKNFDYNKFINYVNKIDNPPVKITKQISKFYLFNLLPILKIKEKVSVKRIYFLGFIPFLKIKTKENR